MHQFVSNYIRVEFLCVVLLIAFGCLSFRLFSLLSFVFSSFVAIAFLPSFVAFMYTFLVCSICLYVLRLIIFHCKYLLFIRTKILAHISFFVDLLHFIDCPILNVHFIIWVLFWEMCTRLFIFFRYFWYYLSIVSSFSWRGARIKCVGSSRFLKQPKCLSIWSVYYFQLAQLLRTLNYCWRFQLRLLLYAILAWIHRRPFFCFISLLFNWNG